MFKRYAVLLAMFSVLCAAPAASQTWPAKSIRIVVPFAAGGTSDSLARAIGPKLTEAWGQPVIIETRAGANGNVGADYVPSPRLTAIRCCCSMSARCRSTRACIRTCRSTRSRTSLR